MKAEGPEFVLRRRGKDTNKAGRVGELRALIGLKS